MSTKKYISLDRMQEYDTLIKQKIASGDDAVLASAKGYADSGDTATLDSSKLYTDEQIGNHEHSWNDLLDRPFGEDVGKGEEVVTIDNIPEVAYVENGFHYYSTGVITLNTMPFVYEGKTIVSLYPDYVCEMKQSGGYAYIGNGSLDTAISGEDTGEPFLIVAYPVPSGVGVNLVLDRDISGQSLSTYEVIETLTTLDPKYIPDSIATTTYVDTATSILKPITTEGDGTAYTATVDGITSLTAGTQITIVPHVVSASTTPTLNVNNSGAKQIRRRLSSIATAPTTGYSATWLAANKPFTVKYDGTYWITEDNTKPVAADLYGTLAVAKGGTGATDAATALTNLGAAAADHTHEASDITAGTLGGQVVANADAQANLTVSQVRNIYAGTTDLVAGTSELATGAIYLVYEP